jgi:hypothetical protein
MRPQTGRRLPPSSPHTFSEPGKQVVLSDAFGGSDALIVVAAFEKVVLLLPVCQFLAHIATRAGLACVEALNAQPVLLLVKCTLH